jgi:peptidoglycan/LPS O-acetylase OafA/YrhL
MSGVASVKHREPIYGLDLIRFLAAMAVLLWHVAYRFFDAGADHIRIFVGGIPAGVGPFHAVSQWGWMGVQVFFVISGLVISYSAEGTTPRRFLLGRFGRLFPGVLVCAALIIAIDSLFWNQSLIMLGKELIKTLAFWPLGGWLVPQFWTLPVEIVFYAIVWAFLAAGASDRLDGLALALIGISALHLTLTALGFAQIHGQLANVLLLKHGMYFALGISLCSIDRKGWSPIRLFVIAVAVLLAAFEIPQSMHPYGVYSAAAPHKWMWPFAIWLAAVALISLSLGWKSEIARLVRAIRIGGLLRTIGLATYPLYLIHIHVAGMAITIALAMGVPLMPALVTAASLCVLVAALIAVVIEPQVRRLVLLPFGGPSASRKMTEVRPELPGLGEFSTEQA